MLALCQNHCINVCDLYSPMQKVLPLSPFCTRKLRHRVCKRLAQDYIVIQLSKDKVTKRARV